MKILIAGDFCPRNRVAPLVEDGNFEEIFGKSIDVIRHADMSILNYESPVADDIFPKLEKVGPNLKSTEKGLEVVKKAGFDFVTLANNHIMDYCKEGLQATIGACKKNGIEVVGVGENLRQAGEPLFKTVGKEKIAIINCCETEFSVATNFLPGSNQISAIRQFYAIRAAREHVDYVVVIVHGGHEHWQLPSPRMVELYRFFVDAGADAVANHHQHCFSGYEVYKGKPIFYGLGNFCMDKTPIRINQPWNFGYMVELRFAPTIVDFTVHPYEQCGEKAGIKLLDKNAFDAEFERLNSIICDEEKLCEATSKYYEESMTQIGNVLNPIQNRYIRKLQKMGVVPSLQSKRWLLLLKDFLFCESHRDKVEYFINNKIN